jgi:glycerophosphoryl diester phosphodiesterase
VQCGILVAHCPSSHAHVLNLLPHVGIRTIVWSFEFVDAALLQQAATRGLTSFVYGLETESDHRRCLQMAIEGVITDHPQFLISYPRGTPGK